MFTNPVSIACCYLQGSLLKHIIKNYDTMMMCTADDNPAKELIEYMESRPLSKWEGEESVVFNNFRVMIEYMKESGHL